MINFASLFNQYRASSNNTINDLLTQQDCTLTQLLDQDSFLTQYKSNNSKLIQFLKYQKMKQLVDYITIIGPQNDKKRSYKYPLTVSDILVCDNQSLLEWFIPEGKIYEDQKIYENQQIQIQMEDNEDIDYLTNEDEKDKIQNQQIKQEKKQEKTIINDTLQTPTTDEEAQQLKDVKIQQPQNKQQQTKQPQKTESQQQHKSEEKPKQKKIKIIKKIVTVQKTQQIQVQPLIHYLYNYFQSQINYILTGYVCKVLTFLFNKRPLQIMNFLFSQNRINKIINHIESRSVGQFLLKIMAYQSNKYVEQRHTFFKSMLVKITQFKQVHILSNFSSFLSQTIEKAALNIKSPNPIQQFTSIFFTPEIITQVIQNVMNDQQNISVYNAPILLTYLTNVPFTLPQDQGVVAQFKQLLKMCIEKSLEKLENVTSRTKLGYGRIKIMEILTYILKENLLQSRQIFAEQKKSFEILFNLCKKYQLNNVLHNQVVKIVNISLTDKQTTLGQALLQNDVLLNFLYQQAKQDQQIRINIKQNNKSQRRYRKGYIGHIVQISRLIQQHEPNSQSAKSIAEKEKFSQILSILVQKQIHQTNKSLAGYRMKKNIKHEVMFQKQDIISHYFDFLTQSPKPVFQPQPQHINIQHPDFVQQLQRQIQQNIISEQQTKIQQNTHDGNQQHHQQNQFKHVHIQFFKGHLDFNVDELMEEL